MFCCVTLDDNQKSKKDEETNILLLLGADVPQGQTSVVKERHGKMKIKMCWLHIELKSISGGRKVWWFSQDTNSGQSLFKWTEGQQSGSLRSLTVKSGPFSVSFKL